MPFIDSKITVSVPQDKRDILKAELGIPANNIYVTYHGINDWGWNGKNF